MICYCPLLYVGQQQFIRRTLFFELVFTDLFITSLSKKNCYEEAFKSIRSYSYWRQFLNFSSSCVLETWAVLVYSNHERNLYHSIISAILNRLYIVHIAQLNIMSDRLNCILFSAFIFKRWKLLYAFVRFPQNWIWKSIWICIFLKNIFPIYILHSFYIYSFVHKGRVLFLLCRNLKTLRQLYLKHALGYTPNRNDTFYVSARHHKSHTSKFNLQTI